MCRFVYFLKFWLGEPSFWQIFGLLENMNGSPIYQKGQFLLTHLFPMLPFSTPCKHVFRG